MNLVNLYIENNTTYQNVGDYNCPPSKYFKFEIPCDLQYIGSYKPKDSDILIIGGGGMLGIYDKELSGFHDNYKILWGTGLNRHDNIMEYPNYMENYNLTGIRDNGYTNDWVPCASCMNPLISKYRDIPPTKDVIIYEHFDHRIDINLPDRMNNWGGDNLEEKLKFISSGKVLLTNTYHGLYWTTLMNRKAVIIDPFSTRFHLFPKHIEISTPKKWESKLEFLPEYPTFLEECKNANIKFHKKVNDFVKSLL